LWWFVLSGVALLVAVRSGRPVTAARPSLRLGRIPRARWLILPALSLSLLAHGQANGPLNSQRPLLALLLWLVGGGLAFVAVVWPLPGERVAGWQSTIRNGIVVTGVVLFVVALLLRAVNLSTIPFILNGSEANIGLDALAVLNGFIRNPFGTGWLTNPTLPLYLLSLPLRLFGPSVLAIRFWSPLIGALTVVAVLVIGTRLWSREVGLVAAVLLAGSHYHLHYSRLGMTNVWDPLLVLLALGLIVIAWEQAADTPNKRLLWAAAGLLSGLNAYLLTSSRLLPLILAGMLVLVVVFQRARLWQERRHLLAAAAVALVVALPQLLYYNANPTIFMERADGLGILAGQSGWLGQEATRSGLSQGEIFIQQFWRAALAFNATLDTSTAYGPPTPLLNSIVGVLWILGFILALARIRQLRFAMPVVWVAVTIFFAGVLLENPPNSHRMLIAAPALNLLAALALIEIACVLAAALRPTTEAAIEIGSQPSSFIPHPFNVLRAGSPSFVFLAAVAILLALWDAGFYFGPYQVTHRFGDRNTEVAARMADYLNELDGGERIIYFYGAPAMYVSFPSLTFLAPQFQAGRNLFDVEPAAASLPAATSPGQVHIFLPERQVELAAIGERYPNGRLRTVDGYYGNPLFLAYEIP
jgi:4-amino-4-deoxy-L-arabinose transferase-like glycosyltransferase